MKEQIEGAINWIKHQPIRGCITGSALLDYFEGQDIDVFTYDEKAFTELYYAMYHNPLFTILDKLEVWKSDMFRQKNDFSNKHHTGVTTIKFMYNTCVPVNIILKKNCSNIFSVLSSFDINIICKGYDLQTKEYLDLTTNPGKVANYNKWNPAFQSNEIWSVSRILRQLERCFKYHKRGYNTDAVILKYIELIDTLQEFQSIFNSENFNDKLKITQQNTLIIKQICQTWLQTHEITEEQIELLKTKIKEI
tara:strand:+ start:699 stop:1448 length:750 start_codon:yes stop_codon:yes gene_type:complete